MSSLRILISVVLLALLIFIVSRAVRIEDLKWVIWDFPKDQFILLLLISVTISILKAWRFLLLLRNSEIEISFWRVFKAYVASQSVTPLPGGEAMRGVLIYKETGERAMKTTAPILTQAFLELFAAAVVAFVGSFVFKQLRIVASLAVILLFLGGFLILNLRILRWILDRLPSFGIIKRNGERLYRLSGIMGKGLFRRSRFLQDKILIKAFFISIFIDILGGLLIWLIARSYEVDLDFFRSMFIYAIGIVIQGLSVIVPGGIGLTEGGMAGILLLSGVPVAKGVAIVVLFRLITLVFSVFVGIFFFMIFYSRGLLFKQKVATG